MKLHFSVKNLLRQLEDKTGKTYSYAQLGEMSKVDQRYIAAWDRGKSRHVRFEHIEKFLYFLSSQGVDVSSACLFTITNEPEPPQ